MSQLNIVPQNILADNGIKFTVSNGFMEFTKDAKTIRTPLDYQTDALRLQRAIKNEVELKYKHAVIVPYLEHMQSQSFDDAWNVKQWFDTPDNAKAKPEECLRPVTTDKVWHGTGIPLEQAMEEDGDSFKQIDTSGIAYHHYIGKGMFMGLFAKANPKFTISICKPGTCPCDEGAHHHAVYGFYRSQIPLTKRHFEGDLDQNGESMYKEEKYMATAAPPIKLPFGPLKVREAGTMKNRLDAAKSAASRLMTVLEREGADTFGTGKRSVQQSECGDSVMGDDPQDDFEDDESITKFNNANEAYQVIMKSDYNRWIAIARDTKNLPWMKSAGFSASIRNAVNSEVQRLQDRIRDDNITSARLAQLIYKKYSGNPDKRFLAYFFKRFSAGDAGISQIEVNGEQVLTIE